MYSLNDLVNIGKNCMLPKNMESYYVNLYKLSADRQFYKAEWQKKVSSHGLFQIACWKLITICEYKEQVKSGQWHTLPTCDKSMQSILIFVDLSTLHQLDFAGSDWTLCWGTDPPTPGCGYDWRVWGPSTRRWRTSHWQDHRIPGITTLNQGIGVRSLGSGPKCGSMKTSVGLTRFASVILD